VKLYIHELVEITGHNRARYQHHMTANWVPVAIEERNQRCYGVWSTLGSTGRWPEVVNMWEFEGWSGLVHNFEHETAGGRDQDPTLAQWWATAASMRRGGVDRILVPDAASPSIDELCAAGARGEVYLHEIVSVPAGTAPDVLTAVRTQGEAAVGEFGIALLGAFRTALRADTECVLLWSSPSWPAWAEYEQAWDGSGALRAWRGELLGRGATWERMLLVDSELAPLRIGRQPAVTDRRPLDSI